MRCYKCKFYAEIQKTKFKRVDEYHEYLIEKGLPVLRKIIPSCRCADVAYYILWSRENKKKLFKTIEEL